LEPPLAQFALPTSRGSLVTLTPSRPFAPFAPLVPFVPFVPGSPFAPFALNVICDSSKALQRCVAGSMIRIVPILFNMHAV
jgi:hypothetical protein